MKNRRFSFLIDKKFQFRFIFYVCSWTFALSMAFPLMLHQLFEFFRRYAMLDPLAAPVETIYQTEAQVIGLLILIQVFFFTVTLLITFYISHRIAGPLFKLRQSFKALTRSSEEEDPQVQFRNTDFFIELANRFNSLLPILQKPLQKNSKVLSHAIEEIQLVQEKLPEPGLAASSLDRALKQLKNQI